MNFSSNRNLRGVFFAALLAAVVVIAHPAEVRAQLDPSMATGSTSSTLRKQAASRIPYRQMSPEVARKVSAVVGDASLYRQLPVTTINSDPDMYLFLLRYPETIISTWRLMGISDMSARRSAPFTLQASDGAGTTTRADLVYGQPNMNIYYAEGQYDGPMLFRKVTGKCVIMVESSYKRGPGGKVQVTSRMNFFMKIDNLAASIIAKTVHPLVGTTADHNFVETLKFAEKLSETSTKNGPGVQRMGTRLSDLNTDVRNRFQEMAGIVWQRAQGDSATSMQTAFSESIATNQRPGGGQSATWHQSANQQSAYQYRAQSPTQQPAEFKQPPSERFRTMQQMPSRQMHPRGRGYSMSDQSSGGYSMGDTSSPQGRNYRGK